MYMKHNLDIKLNEHNNTSIGLLFLFNIWVYTTHIGSYLK